MKSAKPRHPDPNPPIRRWEFLRSPRFRAFAICALAMVGCWVIVWAIGICVCLPAYAPLDARTTDEGEPTVAWKLLAVGPYAWGGKVYDVWGREIIFFLELGGYGSASDITTVGARRHTIMSLRANHTVIEVQHRYSDEQLMLIEEEDHRRGSKGL
jgi:hypothetical protein